MNLDQLLRPSLARAVRTAKATAARASEWAFGRHRLCGTLHGHPDTFYNLCLPGLSGPYLIVRGRVVVSAWAIDLAAGGALAMRVRLGRRHLSAETVARPDVVAAFRRQTAAPVLCGAVFDARLGAGLSTLRIEVEGPDGGWITVFRCPVVSAPSEHGAGAPPGLWRHRDRRAREAATEAADAPQQRAYAGLADGRPAVTVIVEVDEGHGLAETLGSIHAQTFPCREIILVGGATQAAPAPRRVDRFADATALATGEYLLPLRAGDVLAPGAVHHLVTRVRAHAEVDLVYADEEFGADAETAEPFLKPGWSPDTLETLPYIGAPALYRTALAGPLGACDPYDLTLRVTERTAAVHHVRRVLCRRAVSVRDGSREAADRIALAGRLARTGRSGTIATIEAGYAGYAPFVMPPDPAPLVSIVIPTAGRDVTSGGRIIDLVGDCVRAIRERSHYAGVEIVAVANSDMPQAKDAMLRDLGCRVVRDGVPGFNFSRKLNLGVAQARGDLLLLLNDDVAVIAPDWIERLVAQAMKPHVGVVGAKLLYPNDTIQHAGVVLLRANPLHVRTGFPKDDLGYVLSTAGARNYSAVTGACMMVRREVYAAAGGYCEDFPVHFNDIDFCLKVRRLGLHVVYEPACCLYHLESASRRPDIHPEELGLFRSRWAEAIADDPFYANAAFSVAPASFEPFAAADPPAA